MALRIKGKTEPKDYNFCHGSSGTVSNNVSKQFLDLCHERKTLYNINITIINFYLHLFHSM